MDRLILCCLLDRHFQSTKTKKKTTKPTGVVEITNTVFTFFRKKNYTFFCATLHTNLMISYYITICKMIIYQLDHLKF